MEQLVIILLIALISFINWLVKKSAALREARKRQQAADKGESLRTDPGPPQPEAEPDVHMRRLREALGLPEEALPPALPRRMERIPPPLEPPPLPPPPPPARRVVPHVPVTVAREEHRFFEPHRIGRPAPPKLEVARSTSRVRELLGSAGGLRDAVVLSEILGPPRCLRAGEGALWK
jgi:hypothetical protein